MKTLHLTLWLLLGSPLFLSAQHYGPYALFRPAEQYYFSNPYHETAGDHPDLSPIWGMEWPLTTDDTTPVDQLPEFRTLLPTAQAGNYLLSSHLAGTPEAVAEGDTLIFRTLTDDGLLLEIPTGLAVGLAAGVDLICHVDSITEEFFLGVTDSVKYLSIRRPGDTASLLPSLRVSRTYGLLGGVHLGRPFDYSEPFELLGRTGLADGLAFAGPEDVPITTRGDSFCELERRAPRMIDGQLFYEYIQRRYTSRFGSEAGMAPFEEEDWLEIDELYYLADENGTQARDSSYRQSMDYRPYINHTGFIENLHYVYPLGTFLFDRLVYPLTSDCPGPGRTFRYPFVETGEDGTYTVDGGAPSGPEWYPIIFFETGYRDTLTGSFRRVMGVNAASLSCGGGCDFTGLVSNRPTPIDDIRIQLAPNPVATALWIDVPEDLGQVYTQIYDAAGRLLVTTPASTGPRSLAVDQLPAGMYQAVLLEANGRRVAARRFLRQ